MNSMYVDQEVLLRYCDPDLEQIIQGTKETLLINKLNCREPRSTNVSKVYPETDQELKICIEEIKRIKNIN